MFYEINIDNNDLYANLNFSGDFQYIGNVSFPSDGNISNVTTANNTVSAYASDTTCADDRFFTHYYSLVCARTHVCACVGLKFTLSCFLMHPVHPFNFGAFYDFLKILRHIIMVVLKVVLYIKVKPSLHVLK